MKIAGREYKQDTLAGILEEFIEEYGVINTGYDKNISYPDIPEGLKRYYVYSLCNTLLHNSDNIKEIENVSWEFYGEVYGYPKCCIDAFVESIKLGLPPMFHTPHSNMHLYIGSGFIPCTECDSKLKNRRDLISLIGHDPFNDAEAYGILFKSDDIYEKYNINKKIYMLDRILGAGNSAYFIMRNGMERSTDIIKELDRLHILMEVEINE